MTGRFEEAQKLFRKHGGLLRSGKAQQLGVDPNTLAEMVEQGALHKLSRGLYRLAELPPLSHPDLVQAVVRVPDAVICLISALSFQNLTTEIPNKVHIALPQSKKRPKVEYPPLEVFWFSGDAYTEGIDQHLLDGIEVKIYSTEKTIADCFKFRNKIGKDIALESLRAYMLKKNADVEELLYFARIDRVENVMRPYIEALV